MAKLKYSGTMGTPPMVHIDAKSGVTYKPGQFIDAEGKIAAGKPTYLTMGESVDGIVSCIRVREGDIYETTLSAAGTSLKPSSKVTLSADGTQATATTTDGYAEIITMFGTASGSTVHIKF